MKIHGIVLAAGVALSAFAASSAGAANLLVNGSFETGDFTGWTETGNLGFTSVTPSGTGGYAAEDGNYFVFAGAVGSNNLLSQTFVDTPGALYIAAGYMASNGTIPSEFNIEINGDSNIVVDDSAPQPYTKYAFYFTGTGLDTFAVSSRDDPSYIALDNFSVTAATAVPEPMSWALMLIGFGGLGAVARVRRQGALAA